MIMDSFKKLIEKMVQKTSQELLEKKSTQFKIHLMI